MIVNSRYENIVDAIRGGWTIRAICKEYHIRPEKVIEIKNNLHEIKQRIFRDEIDIAVSRLQTCKKLKNKNISDVLTWLISIQEVDDLSRDVIRRESEYQYPSQGNQKPQD